VFDSEVNARWIGRITICYQDNLLLRLSSASGLIYGDNSRQGISSFINMIGGELSAVREDEEKDKVILTR